MDFLRLKIKVSVLLLTLIAATGFLFAAPPKKDKVAERDKALAEADRKAFAENVTAFQRDVKPFLAKHCNRCHGAKRMKGDLSLESLSHDMKSTTSGARWAVVREKLATGEMPPEGEARPAADDIEKVQAWIKAEMKRARRNFTRRQQFVHGNTVPHEKLFDPTHKAPLDVPPRLRRHSAEIYESFRKKQAKGFESLVGNPFTPDPRFLFKDMGSPDLDVPTISQLMRNALTIVERETGHTFEKGTLRPGRGARKELIPFLDSKRPFGQKEMDEVITIQFRRALGRSPTDVELERFVGFLEKNVKEAGRVSGVRHALATVYLLPEAIFRYEVGGKPDRDGKARLTPNEIADAITYALTDEAPPQWLLDDADKGRLDDAAGVRAAVRKILADKKLDKPRILRFFHEYFEYPKATQVFKNPDDFKSHKARVLVSDTDNLVRWILDQDKNVLSELLTTNRAFVNTRYDSKKQRIVRYEAKGRVHQSYNLPPDWKWTSEQPIELPKGTRAGILTQPSWLVAWSVNDDNHAILRGKFVRQRLLGNVVPDIPITVDAQLPNEPQSSLRQRMRVTREEYCWQCHKLMNDVGLPFENYDHFGRWRAIEKGKPVDTTGAIDLTGDRRIDGTRTTDAVDFVHRLAKSERVEQVFIRHAFRYFAGRNENPGDGSSLRAVHQAYRTSGGSFNELIVALLSCESFLYRTQRTAQASATLRKSK